MAETKRNFHIYMQFKGGETASITLTDVDGTKLYRALRNAKSNGKSFKVEKQNGKPFISPKGLTNYKVTEIK